MKHWLQILMIGAGCLILAGCAGVRQAPDAIRYYTLEYPPPEAPAGEPGACILRIERFQAAPAYATNRIIYRETAFERQAYTYHRWRASPADLVAFFLARDLRRANVCTAVHAYDSRFAASHAVEGSVEQFLEDDGPDHWEAVLSLSIALVRENEPDVSRRVLLQRVYTERAVCSEKSPAALAAAMSAAMSRASLAIHKDIRNRLADE
jgi:cholesterol transport system auxiliary component